MAGNELLFPFEVTDGGVEVGVLGNDVEIAAGIGGKDTAEFEGEHEVERVASIDRGLDDPQLLRMLLREEEQRGRELLVAGAENHENPHGPASDEAKVGLADVLIVNEDVLHSGHGRSDVKDEKGRPKTGEDNYKIIENMEFTKTTKIIHSNRRNKRGQPPPESRWGLRFAAVRHLVPARTALR